MKTIQPISIWKDGASLSASIFKMYISYDDLASSATFQYQLLDENLLPVTFGSLTISGTDYANWGSSGDSNAEAYVYGATTLSLTVTGDYTPPAPAE